MQFLMNAHINLDLSIAAARTSPGDEVYDLKNDFNRYRIDSLSIRTKTLLRKIKKPLKNLSSMALFLKPKVGERCHNYVGAPDNRIIGSCELVLTPQAEDINLVLGPVVTRSPDIRFSKFFSGMQLKRKFMMVFYFIPK